ncbi:quinolinate synthase [Desulfosarcina sp. BuS5]|uniref:quinolinate synthase NadA n=1 Tax=Desulfosarcina sp. BuS5 TaxID=933262 RepID=UPI000687C825|nr:quinolinate synthase NadA [Desulfosarcina sp. BuS5]WDN87284.1 quinolinate synthase [Desulfosarcina sp. BuS5]
MHYDINEKEIIKRIKTIKKKLGKELVILTHHYQRKEIVYLGDYGGDSFALSRQAAMNNDARFIVFCGVNFMAESAEILSQPNQIVQIPDLDAGCWMANMADISIVDESWEQAVSVIGEDKITPVVYMNADAVVKDFCGKNGGIICTSSNAPEALKWSFKRREKIFFFPDKHLGRNTANRLGIPPEEVIIWNPETPFGGNTKEAIKKAKIILWEGYCLVHTRFQVEDILKMRNKFPDAKVVVHPECPQEVVGAADDAGSTSFIVNYVDQAPAGATIVIGTEINLIDRLAFEYPEKKILALKHSLCPNMSKITLQKLLWSLENVGKVNIIKVPYKIKKGAKKALDRMLTL